MPKRTTAFQMIVHFVRQHWAGPDVTVTESKMLLDAALQTEREVDIVIEGTFDGDPVVTSIEVVEHGRPATLPWAEQQIAKHRHLPTNRLVLVSQSGFAKNAIAAVAAEGGWVEALTPEPLRCELFLLRPDGQQVVVDALINKMVFDDARLEVGTTLELTQEFLSLD
jgi:hypothetical protein